MRADLKKGEENSMLALRIKEYLAQVDIHRCGGLDTALIETFGQSEGERHIG